MMSFMRAARALSSRKLLVALLCFFNAAGSAHAAPTPLPPSSGTEVQLQTAFPGISEFSVQPGVTITNTGTAVSGNNSQTWNFTNCGILSSTSATNNPFSGLFLGAGSSGAPTVTNFGSISSVSTQSSGSSGVRFSGGGTVRNMAGGTIAGFDGVHSDGGPVFVYNSGLIQGTSGGGTAVYGGGGGVLYNLSGGVISGLNFGYQLNGFGRNGLLDNAGQINAQHVAVAFSNGETFAIINRPTGVITSQGNQAISVDATTGYFVNQGVVTASNTVFRASDTINNIVVNAGVLTAGNNGDAIQTAADDSNSTIYNLGRAVGAGAGYAVRLDGSNTLLVLGTQAYLPALDATITGPGSVLVGGALSTGSNNSIRLTDSGSESASLVGFVSLTMHGQNWALSAPLSLSGASSQSLAVESGELSLSGPFVTPGGIFISTGGRLNLFSTAQAATANLSSGGGVTLANSAALNISGNITLSGGSFAATGGSVTANNINLADASQWTQTRGNIIAPTIALSGASQWTQTGGSVTTNNLSLIGASRWAQGGNLAATSLALSDGSQWTQSNGNLTANNIRLTGASQWTQTSGNLTANNINLTGASQWTQSGGNIIAPTIALSGNSQWTQTGGSVTANNLSLVGASRWAQGGNLAAASLALSGGSKWAQVGGASFNLTGPLTLSGSVLSSSGDVRAASAEILAGSSMLMTGRGTLFIPSIHVSSGSLFRLNSSAARFTLPATTNLNLDSGSRYGVTVSRNPEVHSIMFAERFTPVEGVLLDTRVHSRQPSSGISFLPAGDYFFQGVVQTQNPVIIPTSMQITANSMRTLGMTADGNNADLGLSLRSINSVFGPNLEAADVWRVTSLPGDIQRARLDDIYATGVLAKDTREFFELLQGSPLLAAQQAQWENLRSFSNAVRARLHGNIPEQAHGTDLLREIEGHTVLWGDVRQYWSDQEGDGERNLRGYSYSPTQVLLGLEHARENWKAGFAIQYSNGEVSSSDNDAVTEIQGGIFGIYGEYILNNWYGQLGAQFGLARNEATTRYGSWGDDTRASYNSTLWGANAEIGYRVYLGDPLVPWVLTPHAGIDAGSLRQNGFSENGDFALRRHFDGNTYEVVEVPVGLRVAKSVQIGDVTLTGHADAAYAFNTGNEKPATAGRFLNAPAESWELSGVEPGRDALRFDAGVSAAIGQGVTVELSYGLETREHYTTQGVSLALGIKF